MNKKNKSLLDGHYLRRLQFSTKITLRILLAVPEIRGVVGVSFLCCVVHRFSTEESARIVESATEVAYVTAVVVSLGAYG